MIFGGNLENCQLQLYNEGSEMSGIDFLRYVSVSSLNSTRSDVSSSPLQVCVCDGGGTITACASQYSVKVMRGELYNLSLITVGQLYTPVSAPILVSSDEQGSVRYDPEFPVSYSTCTNVSVWLLASKHVTNKTVYFYPDGPCGNVVKTRVTFFITLEECSPGFEIVNDRCDCERRLRELAKDNNLTCNINTQTISRPGNAWMQPMWDKNHSEYLGFIWHDNCPLGYCKSTQEPIELDFSNMSTSDSLCTENRTGRLCGACRQNYSLTLHDYTCRVCENKFLSLLLFFAVSGIALIAVLLVLRITVATGTINGLILYANIVSVNRDIFFPPDIIDVYPLTVFLAWLNLDFGVSTCFYDGLDAYVYAWLQYLFPIYLWCLIGVIIVINKLPIKISGLFGNNPVAVLATVILISYTKLLQSSIVALTYTPLDYPDSKTFSWLYDGTITVWEGKHLYLAVAAILVIAFLILPYILLLTFGYRLLAFSNRRYCFWFNTFKPFLDPYYAPFNGKTRYWSGFLLLVRGGLYVGFAFNALGNPNANLVAISVVFLVLAAIPWLGHRIYEKLYLNILEVSFILNVCVLSTATYYVRSVGGKQAIVTYLSVGIAFTEFVGIIIFHSFILVKEKLCRKQLQRDMPGEAEGNHAPPVDQHQRNPPFSAAQLREPLLEDDDY